MTSDGVVAANRPKFDFVRFGLLFVGVAFLMAMFYFLIVGSIASDIGAGEFYILERMSAPPPEQPPMPIIACFPTPDDHTLNVIISMIPAFVIALVLESEIGKRMTESPSRLSRIG